MANNAITAKARAIHGSFLTQSDYTVMMHKGSVPAAVAFLKTKPLYAAAFADTDEAQIHREQAEMLINKSVFENYLRICRYAQGKKDGIMSFHIRQTETEQLIKAVIAVSSGAQSGFLAAFPDYISDYMCYDPMALAGAKDLAALLPPLKGTMFYKPLKKLLEAPQPDINKIITTINICYISWAFRQIDECTSGKTRDRLKDFFLRKTDADNLLLCYRLKSTFDLDNERIKELLIPYHKRLRRCEIEEALKEQDPVATLRDMFIGEGITNVTVSDIPEINVAIADYRYFRHCLAVSTNEVEALYSLMMLFKAESTNLCRIIEGIRYGLPPEETEKYLII